MSEYFQIKECAICMEPAEKQCTNATCVKIRKEYFCSRCDALYHHPKNVSRGDHNRISIIEAGKFICAHYVKMWS